MTNGSRNEGLTVLVESSRGHWVSEGVRPLKQWQRLYSGPKRMEWMMYFLLWDCTTLERASIPMAR